MYVDAELYDIGQDITFSFQSCERKIRIKTDAGNRVNGLDGVGRNKKGDLAVLYLNFSM